MLLTIFLIIIFSITIGIIAFFVVKSIISPKKISHLTQLYKNGKISALTRQARQIIAKDSRNSDAHYYLGLAYLADNKPELALMELRTVNQIGTFSTACPEMTFRETIGNLYLRFDHTDEALKEFLLLIKMNPQTAKYYYMAGQLFESRSKSDKAVQYYRKAVELDPRHSDAHYRLGYILFRSKKLLEAKNELEMAVKFNQQNYQAYFYLGRILKENHDHTAALLALEKAQRDTDFRVKAIVERGSCFMTMKNYDKAIAELERAVKLAEDDSASEALYGRYFLGICYESIRNIDKAIEAWEKVYAKKPNFRDVAEKLSQYQDIRQNDHVKDYLTSSTMEFAEICKAVTQIMGVSVRDVTDIPNGCQIMAVESDSKWRNAKKLPKLLWFLRIPDMITESTVRAMHESMKKQNISRGIIISSSNYSRKSLEFAESRPIDLINREKLQELLQKVNFDEVK